MYTYYNASPKQYVPVPTHSTTVLTLVVISPGVSKLKERMDATGLTDRFARGDREHESDEDAHNRYVHVQAAS